MRNLIVPSAGISEQKLSDGRRWGLTARAQRSSVILCDFCQLLWLLFRREQFETPHVDNYHNELVIISIFIDTYVRTPSRITFPIKVIAPYLEEVGNDSSRAHSCKAETATQLLSNVKEIHNLHVDFHSEMENVFIPAPFHTHCIGKLFLRFVSCISLTYYRIESIENIVTIAFNVHSRHDMWVIMQVGPLPPHITFASIYFTTLVLSLPLQPCGQFPCR